MFTPSIRTPIFTSSILVFTEEKLVGTRINDLDRYFLQNFTVFQACLIEKIYLPRFCYHASLSIAGNCRMCLVEEKSTVKPVASCAVNIDGGMEIYTHTVMVKKAREGVLEYLLINHPLDCPICDQGGECDLQDQTMVFGADRGRFYEDKRTISNKNFGFLIKTFFNRCIYCTRCVRFMVELGGLDTLGMLGRGVRSEIGTYFDNFLVSEVSGNIIDLCPVGALTSKPYAYRARVWELAPIDGFDIIDSFGASIKIECRGLEVMRILPASNDVLNEEWISDRSRFFYDCLQLQRLISPLIYKKKEYKEISWTQSFRLLKNYFLLYLRWFRVTRGGALALLFGSLNDLETLAAGEDFSDFSGLSTFAAAYRQMSHEVKKQRAYYTLRSARLLELSTYYLVCGLHLRFESPIMNMKLVQLYENTDVEIFILGRSAQVNVEFHHTGSLFSDSALICLVTDDYFYKITKPLVLYGHGFLQSKGLVASLRLFKAKFSFIGLNIVDVGLFESGRVKENLHQHQKNFSLASLIFNLAGDDQIWLRLRGKLQRQLRVYIGHHGGSAASCANVILPAPVFIEKCSSFLNNCAFFLSSYFYEYRFNMKTPKQEWQIFRALNEILGFRRRIVYTTSEQVRYRLNNMTPLQSTYGNYYRKLHFLPPSFRYHSSLSSFLKLNIKAAAPNFYKINILCIMSKTLELCSDYYIKMLKINEIDNVV